MKNTLDAPRLLLLMLLGIGGAGSALQAQTPSAPAPASFQSQGEAAIEMPEHEIKARAEIWRLAASSSVADRRSAVEQLAASYMDYPLLWQLMNDPGPGVRSMAISALTAPSCTTVDAQPLSTGLAQKMAAMLEKEVTPERIRAAFEPGHVKDYESGLITTAAETLNHLYRYHARLKSPAEYTAWQRRVLKPLFLAAAGGGTTSESLRACAMDLFTTLIETSLLQEALPVVLQKLDDPALPAPWRLPTLETLWQHPQLGNDKPLNALLLAQLAPRLEALRPRILGPMQDGQDKEQAARLLNEIAEVIQTTRAKLGPQPATAAPK